MNAATKPLNTQQELSPAVNDCLAKTQAQTGECLLSSNGIIDNWDVSKVPSFADLFKSKQNFQQDLSKWNTGSVTSMRQTFYHAHAFNSDISKWNVSKVVDMENMFRDAKKFNQDLSPWNVVSVTEMNFMFHDATAFAKTLCSKVWIDLKKKRMQHGGFTDVFKASQGSICGTMRSSLLLGWGDIVLIVYIYGGIIICNPANCHLLRFALT